MNLKPFARTGLLRPDTVPLEETLTAFSKLVEAGKVRAIGASNYSAARLREALSISGERGLPRYEVLQPGCSLYDRARYESELAGLAQEQGLGVVSTSRWPAASSPASTAASRI